MANITLRFKDMTFEKVENYDPENAAADKKGMVSYWVGMTPDGEQVVTGENKKKCIAAARAYVHEVNEAAETAESEAVEEQICEEQATEQPEAIEEETQEVASEEEKAETTETEISEATAEESEINMWLMGYIPKKKQPAILMLRKDDEGYWCRIGNGFIVETGKGEYDDIIHEAKWKEFLKSLRNVVKAA